MTEMKRKTEAIRKTNKINNSVASDSMKSLIKLN